MKMNVFSMTIYYQISMFMFNIMCCLRNNQINKRFDFSSFDLKKYLIDLRFVIQRYKK